MKKILLLGAGKSTPYLIKYLAENGGHHWQINIADVSEQAALQRSQGFNNTVAIGLKQDAQHTESLINTSDIVISMLPPSMHLEIALLCLKYSKHLLTASYTSTEINALNDEAVKKNIMILMEMGLDPGIDHMSALDEIDKVREMGGHMVSFKSYTGGLIAPESDTNPWNYKITWNPRNVILAGQGTVKYLENNRYKFINYQQLFKRLYLTTIDGYGSFEGYANRDSLKYLSTYQLQNINTFIRGTLRRPGFCTAWNALSSLGLTDDSFIIENADTLTHLQFTTSFLPEGIVREKDYFKWAEIAEDSSEAEKIRFLELFSEERIELEKGTPAQIFQSIVEKKLRLEKEDKDMVVMQHELEYMFENSLRKKAISLVNIGSDSNYTAMAKTVGLPLGIATKLILEGSLRLKGVHLPVIKEIYKPLLAELANNGINFNVNNS